MTTIKGAFDDLFDQRLPADEAVDLHFAAGFRQRTNGSWEDRTGFLARVVELRQVVEHAGITVLDEHADGNRYAERHVVDLVQRNGLRIVQEVYVFAERDSDGRFVRIDETTLMLEDDEDDRRLVGAAPPV